MKFSFQPDARVTSTTLHKIMNACLEYRERLQTIVQKKDWSAKEASLLLPRDKKTQTEVAKLVSHFNIKRLKKVVVIGIGGSNLGAQAVYEAMKPHTTKPLADLLFLDTVSPAKLKEVENQLRSCTSSEQFVLVAISKSGSTTETMVNLEVLLHGLQKKFKDVHKRLVVISDLGSKFWNAAKDKKIHTLAIPASVGGRFSVFSAVGLFPLALVGIDVYALVRGAKQSLEENLGSGPNQTALVSAALLYRHAQEKRIIHNSFFFAPELESLGKWYRQLMGESLGKEKDASGKKVNTGITPIVSIGSTDLHSMAQLYMGGPDDKFTSFVTIDKVPDVSVPPKLMFTGMVDHIERKGVHEVMEAIAQGVKAAYTKTKRPFMTFAFETSSERELGYYMQTRMLEIMYVAHLLKINAFDQPNVEGYKVETKRRLAQ